MIRPERDEDNLLLTEFSPINFMDSHELNIGDELAMAIDGEIRVFTRTGKRSFDFRVEKVG